MEVSLSELLRPDVPLLEIVLRGTFVYLSIFILLRVIVKQAAGSLNLADLLLIVLIADAAQNAMAGEYTSVTDGIVLVLTLAFWNLALDWLSYHWQWFGRWVHPQPVPLVASGVLNRRNLRKELITFEELMTYIRQAGGTSVEDVQAAWVEGNGEVSVQLRDREETQPSPRNQKAAAG